MARLIVDAVSNEKRDFDDETIMLTVSVSRADDGASVTGLTAQNFAMSNTEKKTGFDPVDYNLQVSERNWDAAAQPSGIYDISITNKTFSKVFADAMNYTFGLRVKTFSLVKNPIDIGQTVISVASLGKNF